MATAFRSDPFLSREESTAEYAAWEAWRAETMSPAERAGEFTPDEVASLAVAAAERDAASVALEAARRASRATDRTLTNPGSGLSALVRRFRGEKEHPLTADELDTIAEVEVAEARLAAATKKYNRLNVAIAGTARDRRRTVEVKQDRAAYVAAKRAQGIEPDEDALARAYPVR